MKDRPSDIKPRVLLLSGISGAGKTTMSYLIVEKLGWKYISEDEIWHKLYGEDCGDPNTDEGFTQVKVVHKSVFRRVRWALGRERSVVIDFLIMDCPPRSVWHYQDYFLRHAIPYEIRILRPALAVAIKRDAERKCWTIGKENLRALYELQSEIGLPSSCYINNSEDSPLESFEKHFSGWEFMKECPAR